MRSAGLLLENIMQGYSLFVKSRKFLKVKTTGKEGISSLTEDDSFL
jgi:hypothetical protein